MDIHIFIFFGYVMAIYIIFVESALPGTVQDYCISEDFTASCLDNEVIVMSKAQYGRMKMGRCITRDYGYIGCASNILDSTDRICSGRQSCHIAVPNTEMTELVACPRDLTAYLEAGYKCQEVYVPRHRCYSTKQLRITVDKKGGYYASNTAKTTSCGLHGAPLVVEGQSGQKISLKLLDFAWQNNSNSDEQCLKYGYILDMESDDVFHICGGGEDRQKPLYVSQGHSVQIVLDPSIVQTANFLIKYEAIGCPDLDTPSNSWIKKENNTITIGCISSSDRWRLLCVNNQWLGIVGTCPATTTETPEIKEDDRISGDNNPKDSNLPHVSNNHVVAFALGCVTVLICCSVIILGIFCTKRYEAKIKKHKHRIQHKAPSTPVIATLPRNTLVYQHVSDIHQQATLPIYTLPIVCTDRPPAIPTRPPSCRNKGVDEASGSSEDLLFMGDDKDTVKYSASEKPSTYDED